MTLKIVKGSDPIEIKAITVLVYGQAGIGKTSTGFTTKKPLCLDFDRGSHRSQFRKDTVRIEHWLEVEGLTTESLKPYDTIIIDTGGCALDFLTEDIGYKNPKMKRGDSLTLQGFGELRGRFTSWVKRLKGLGKDLVFIAHDKEDKQNDDLYVRPDIVGGSRGELFKISDGVAYMFRRNGETILDFSPRDESLGKNPAQLAPLIVPSFHDEPDWFAKILAHSKSVMGKVAESQSQVEDLLTRFTDDIAHIKDAADANELLTEINSLDKSPVVTQIKRKLSVKIKKIGLEWVKESKAFLPKPPTSGDEE